MAPGCPVSGTGGAEAGWKPHYPIEEFPHCGELEKHLLEASRPPPAPVLLPVNLENLNCFSITEEEKGGGTEGEKGEKKKKKEKEKAKKRRRGCKERARVPAVQLAAGRTCPQHSLKNKGARATFQWKISGDGPDAPQDGYLAPMINHKRQRKALQEEQRG